MLKNSIYTGRVTNRRLEVTDFITGTRKDLPEEEWIVVERPEMRIISDELFNRTQEILAQRSNEFKLNSKREKKNIYLVHLYIANTVDIQIGTNPTVITTIGGNSETENNGKNKGQVIPESIEIKGVFLSTRNPVVRFGLIIK